MSARVAVVAGVIAGLATVAIVVGALLASSSTPVVSPPPSYQLPSPSPSPSPSPLPSPSLSPSPSPSGGGTFHVGEPAPALVVPELGGGGGMIDLANLRGKPVWVNFWGSYCPPCVDEFPLMNGYAAKYESNGLVILAINVRETEEQAATFATGLKAIFPIGLDPNGSVATAWDAVVLPVHYWIDAAGIIRAGAAGGIGPDQMEAGLATILPSGSGSPAPSGSGSPAPSGSSSPAPSAGSPSPSPSATRSP